MSRWDSREETTRPLSDSTQREPGRVGGADDQERESEVRTQEVPTSEARTRYRDCGRTYMLRASEIQTMTDIGKFRALAAKDIEAFLYGGDKTQMGADFSNLRRQRLILERDIPEHENPPRRLVALTKEGRHLLTATNTVQKGQVLYHGFTKPREADHDADLYKLYQRGLERASRAGGKNIRVILDSELKRILYRDLARASEHGSGEAKSAIAERHGLRVVRDTIPVPDLRIEYETADGEPARLDLELATEHYRFRNIARKVQAGFSIYARSQDAQNLRRVLDQREITAEILNL
jgi:hypothetical protein